MESLESSHNLDEDIPYLLLFNVGLPLLIVAYFLKDISIIGVLHDQAKKMNY